MKKCRINVIQWPGLFPGPLKRQSIMHSEWSHRGLFFCLLCSPSSLHFLLPASLLFFFHPRLPPLGPTTLLLFAPFPSSCIFKRMASSFRSALFVFPRRNKVPCLRNNHVVIVVQFRCTYHCWREAGKVLRGWDTAGAEIIFVLATFTPPDAVASSCSHLLGQQEPVPLNNKCFSGLPTTLPPPVLLAGTFLSEL